MRIGFFTDTHLGSTLYRGARGWRTSGEDLGSVRREDILSSFEAATDLFLAERPDIVIHLGDLLEGRASATIFEDLYTSIEGLKKLLNAGIKVVLMEGNHDFRRYADGRDQPFTVIESSLENYVREGKLVVVRAGTYRIVEGWTRVPMVALGYHEEGDGFRRLSDTLHKVAKELGDRKAILLTHQTVGDVWGIPEFYRIEDIPKNFPYVFNGHIHKRKLVVRKDPLHIFINPGSIEYQDMGEAQDLFGLVKRYEELEREFGQQVALDMFRRLIVKGVIFLDLDNLSLRSLVAPEVKRIEGDEIPPEYWTPIFYHPLRTSRPFIKAHLREEDFDSFRDALNTLLSLLNRVEAKSPVLSVEVVAGGDGFSKIQSYLIGLLERGRLVALRLTHRVEVEVSREMGAVGNEDRYAVFGEYADVIRRVGEKIEEILDLKARREEARRGEKRLIDEKINALKSEVRESVLNDLYTIAGKGGKGDA